MIGDGMSSQGAFAANSGGESACSGNSTPANSSSEKSSAKVVSSVSTSYLHTSYGDSYSSSGTEKSSPPSVNVSFNSHALEMAWVARGNDSFKDTTRHLLANKNEKSQALYAHEQNGKVILDRMASKAHQELHYDLMRDTSFNRTRQYSHFANMHDIQYEQLHAKFNQRQQRIRDCGMTLSLSFDQKAKEVEKARSPTPEHDAVKQRTSAEKSFPPHKRDNGRERGR